MSGIIAFLSSILASLTLVFGIIIGKDGGWVNGALFALGFFVATGAGAVLNKFISGELEYPIIMLPVSVGVLALAYLLGSHGSISITLFDYPIHIFGGIWAIVAGPLAGYSPRLR